MKSPNVTPRMQYVLQVGHRDRPYLTTISNFISYRICLSSVNASGLHVMLAALTTIAHWQIHENVIIFYLGRYFCRLNGINTGRERESRRSREGVLPAASQHFLKWFTSRWQPQ